MKLPAGVICQMSTFKCRYWARCKGSLDGDISFIIGGAATGENEVRCKNEVTLDIHHIN